MGSLESPAGPATPLPAPAPKIWKFWGTTLWGALIFAAMFAGQFLLVAGFFVAKGPPFDFGSIKTVAGSGTVISLSVIMGLPAVVAVLWLAIRLSGTPFAEYLALRRTSWTNLAIGIVALIALVIGWDIVSRAIGREIAPGFMVDVLKSAQADGALWLLVVAFSVAAPVTEELMVRGFLYRGWSESFLGTTGAIVLSSLVWTAMHAQYYDWFPFSEVMSIGLLLGYMRYRSRSTWLTIIMHGLNNFAATAQTIWLAGQH
ncbi:MAG TPA: CPBP family glutamic-type intramembrane protease [Bradyrhizobium sp.]|nr:CPBP family glutamic-type intramembrane protease [Bradyrhizobium sp.]